jgi:hypothetical protein
MEITHQCIDGRMIQVVSPERLRQILDREGSDYTRPTDFGPDDQWEVSTQPV